MKIKTINIIQIIIIVISLIGFYSEYYKYTNITLNSLHTIHWKTTCTSEYIEPHFKNIYKLENNSLLNKNNEIVGSIMETKYLFFMTSFRVITPDFRSCIFMNTNVDSKLAIISFSTAVLIALWMFLSIITNSKKLKTKN